MPTIRCPSCDKALKVPSREFGEKRRCPSCKEVIVVPDEDEKPARSVEHPFNVVRLAAWMVVGLIPLLLVGGTVWWIVADRAAKEQREKAALEVDERELRGLLNKVNEQWKPLALNRRRWLRTTRKLPI